MGRVLTHCQRLWLATLIARTHPRPVRTDTNPSISAQTTSYSTSLPSQSISGLRHRKDRNPNNTIWNAAQAGDADEVERQLQSGVDVDAYCRSHGTPLSVAAYNGRAQVVECLLSRGAALHGYYAGYHDSALHSAADRGHESIVRSLLEHGADVNVKACGVGAIHAAASKGHWGSVQLLLNSGADENSVKELLTSIFQSETRFYPWDPVARYNRKVGSSMVTGNGRYYHTNRNKVLRVLLDSSIFKESLLEGYNFELDSIELGRLLSNYNHLGLSSPQQNPETAKVEDRAATLSSIQQNSQTTEIEDCAATSSDSLKYYPTPTPDPLSRKRRRLGPVRSLGQHTPHG